MPINFQLALISKRGISVERKEISSSLRNTDMFLTIINILYSYDMVYAKILYFELNFHIKYIVIM